MPLYAIDIRFLEPSAASCTIESGSSDEAILTVKGMLSDAGATDIEIVNCEVVATDDQHEAFKNSLN